jgi:hypothetical protein
MFLLELLYKILYGKDAVDDLNDPPKRRKK